MLKLNLIRGLILAHAGLAAARQPTSPDDLSAATYTNMGCFKSIGVVGATSQPFMYNSAGFCINRCKGEGLPVAALHSLDCVCAAVLPARVAVVKDSECNLPCPGYPMEACGGRDAFSVYAAEVAGLEDEDEDEQKMTDRVTASGLESAYNAAVDSASQLVKAAQDFFSACLGRKGALGEKTPPKQAPAEFEGTAAGILIKDLRQKPIKGI